MNRRTALGRMFGAALAAPTAAEQLAKAVAHPKRLWESGLLSPQSDQCEPPSSTLEPGIINFVLRQARSIFRARAREIEVRNRYRAGRFDHDVHVMGSWSLAFKAQIQRRRDEADEGMLDKLRRAAFPDQDPDD